MTRLKTAAKETTEIVTEPQILSFEFFFRNNCVVFTSGMSFSFFWIFDEQTNINL